MKQFLLSAFVMLAVLSACNNDKKLSYTQKNEDGSSTTTKVDVKGMNEAADEANQKTEELKKLTPLNLDQLKAMLPEELDGMKRTNYNTSSAMGYSFAQGDYQKDETTTLQVMIYDCAGEAGSAWYAATFWGAMNFQQESQTEYTKTIDFMGGRAIENYKKDTNRSTLTYNANDRLLVVLTGDNMKPEELKDVAKKLTLKV